MSARRKYDVFISYSAEDREWVSQFVDALNEAGVTTWFDVDRLLPGMKIQDEIEAALRASRTLVAVVSPNSVDSPSLFFTVGAAIADQKRIVPVIRENLDVRQVPFPLLQYQPVQAPTAREAGQRVAEALLDAEQPAAR